MHEVIDANIIRAKVTDVIEVLTPIFVWIFRRKSLQ